MQEDTKNYLKKDNGQKKLSQDIEEEKIFSSFVRSEKFKNWIHWGLIAITGLSVIVVLAIMASLGWHLVVSKNYHWLEDDQISDLKNVILSGSVAGNLIFFIRFYFLNDDP